MVLGGSPRLVPVAALPFWDLEQAVREVERTARIGHRGINLCIRPEDHGAPPLRDPHWNPLWSVIQETDLPVSFHIGGGDTSEVTDDHHGIGTRANMEVRKEHPEYDLPTSGPVERSNAASRRLRRGGIERPAGRRESQGPPRQRGAPLWARSGLGAVEADFPMPIVSSGARTRESDPRNQDRPARRPMAAMNRSSARM